MRGRGLRGGGGSLWKGGGGESGGEESLGGRGGPGHQAILPAIVARMWRWIGAE